MEVFDEMTLSRPKIWVAKPPIKTMATFNQ